jgi:hypothetical protein
MHGRTKIKIVIRVFNVIKFFRNLAFCVCAYLINVRFAFFVDAVLIIGEKMCFGLSLSENDCCKIYLLPDVARVRQKTGLFLEMRPEDFSDLKIRSNTKSFAQQTDSRFCDLILSNICIYKLQYSTKDQLQILSRIGSYLLFVLRSFKWQLSARGPPVCFALRSLTTRAAGSVIE